MNNLIDQGKIHYWGTSWWAPHLVERAIGIAKQIGCVPPAVEQPPYHMRARFIENDLFEVARYHGLGITAFEGLSLGLFTGKYNEQLPPDSRFAKLNIIDEEGIKPLQERLVSIDEICQELELTMYQLALAWVLHNPEISSTVMGASKPEQVIMNATASGISITDEIVERLNEINEDRIPTFDYRYS
jgi:aryl-alcohol dehydrogenase-like predicted oxidoreductase